MFRRYSPSATEPAPRLPVSIASRSVRWQPALLRARTRYRMSVPILSPPASIVVAHPLPHGRGSVTEPRASASGHAQIVMTPCLTRRRRLQERPPLELLVGLPELLLGIHHDRAVPRHWLLQWLSRHQEETDPFVSGLHGDFVAAVKKHQRAVIRLLGRRRVGPSDSFGRHRERTRCVAELPRPSENVREGVTSRLNREGLPPPWRD